RVLAVADAAAVAEEEPPPNESALAGRVRTLVTRVTGAMGLRCVVRIQEGDATVTATCTGGELGLLIGKHGQTIDSLQYLVNAIVARGPYERKAVVIDSAAY